MEWYYAKHGKQDGPVDVATLRGKLQSGQIAPTDLVWKDGMAEWTAAGEIAELTADPAPTVTPGGMLAQPGQAAQPGQVAQPGQAAQPGQVAGQPYAGGYVMPVAPTCGMAIASMICGIVGLVLCYVNAIAAIPAVICGHMALKQINNSVVPMGGRGMAIAGLVTGYIGILFQVGMIGIIVVAIMSEM